MHISIIKATYNGSNHFLEKKKNFFNFKSFKLDPVLPDIIETVHDLACGPPPAGDRSDFASVFWKLE